MGIRSKSGRSKQNGKRRILSPMYSDSFVDHTQCFQAPLAMVKCPDGLAAASGRRRRLQEVDRFQSGEDNRYQCVRTTLERMRETGRNAQTKSGTCCGVSMRMP